MISVWVWVNVWCLNCLMCKRRRKATRNTPYSGGYRSQGGSGVFYGNRLALTWFHHRQNCCVKYVSTCLFRKTTSFETELEQWNQVLLRLFTAAFQAVRALQRKTPCHTKAFSVGFAALYLLRWLMPVAFGQWRQDNARKQKYNAEKRLFFFRYNDLLLNSSFSLCKSRFDFVE